MHKGLSLRVKLSLAFLSLAVLVGAVGALQIQTLERIRTLFEDVITVDIGRLNKMQLAHQHLLEMEEELLQHQIEGTVPEHGDEKDGITHQAEAIKKEIKEYADSPRNGAPLALDVAATNDTIDRLAALALSSITATHHNNKAQALAAFGEFTTLQSQLEGDMGRIIASERESILGGSEEVVARINGLVATDMPVVGLIIAIAVILGLLVASRLTKALALVRRGAQDLANGNLAKRVEVRSGDEIGQLAMAFNQMADRLSDSYSRIALEGKRDETILESLGEGLIALDTDAQVVLINSKALELFELSSRNGVVGKKIASAVTIYGEHDVVLEPEQHPAFAVLQTAKQINESYSFVRKDGKKILINIIASPVLLDGKVTGAIFVIRDVTKEKEVDRMKTEFISLASHQLRTPLSAIKWFTEMLVSGDAGKLNAEQLDFAKNVADSTERMIELVNSLLNISRIESGRIIVDPKPTDLNVLVGGIVNDLKAKTAEREQTLVVSIHKDLPKINLDPRLIGQVYMNFLTNAIKYTPKGGEITVFVSRKDDELVSQISDNGYGIPKAQQDKLFQKFFRADNVSKVETDGTGLGLYLVKAIIESSGGRVWFKSEENKGTTFWFSLPMSGMKAKEGEVTLDV
ncbi:MAG TPA: ATP-binding protein [Candidatus Saccharimonadales bacterium]|nr:ATP-binding protein [Candidatus Saccharimonadales bacterium]